MKTLVAKKTMFAALIAAAVALSACTTEQVIDNSVGVAAGTTKVIAKGTVGAGKLAYKGGKKLVVGSSE